MQTANFLNDMLTLSRRAREVCGGRGGSEAESLNYEGAVPRVIALLNAVIAAELVSVQHCRHQHPRALEVDAAALAAEFLDHANNELRHVDALAARIDALGGRPDFGGHALLTRSEAKAGHLPLVDALLWDLAAERVAIECFKSVRRWVGATDPVSGRLLDEALATEIEYTARLGEQRDALVGDLPPDEPLHRQEASV